MINPTITHGRRQIGGLTHIDYLKASVGRTPNKEALVDTEINRRLTYLEFDLETNKMANVLLSMGLKHGDHIAYLSYNRGWITELWYGAAKVGIAVAPVNWRYVPREMQYIVDHSDAKALIFGEEFLEAANEMRSNLPKVEHYLMVMNEPDMNFQSVHGWVNDFWGMVAKASDGDPEVKISSNDILCLIYTSGTTARPKGVMHSHNTSLGWMFCMDSVLGRDIEWRNLMWGPMFHWGSFVRIMPDIYYGATAVIMTFNAVKAWEIIDREKITHIGGAPAMSISLLNVPNWQNKYDGSSVTSVHFGAAPPIPAVIEQVVKAFPNARLSDIYTSSEAFFSGSSHEMLMEEAVKKGRPFGGLPALGTEISIRDVNDNSKALNPGEIGVIYGRGPSTHLGYYKNEEENTKTFLPKGWQTSEDMGYIEPGTGYLYVTDRLKDVICTAGENVSSIEVESVVMECPKVAECAVIGTPDPFYNQKVSAIVVLKPGERATPEEIMEFCRNRMAGFKRPRWVDIVNSLPKSPVGKILKKDLREEYWKGHDRRV